LGDDVKMQSQDCIEIINEIHRLKRELKSKTLFSWERERLVLDIARLFADLRRNPLIRKEISILDKNLHVTRGIGYKRKIYCIYRLYKYGLTPEEIQLLLSGNFYSLISPHCCYPPEGEPRIFLDCSYVRSKIGEAFKQQCLKSSCWAKPFLMETEPNSRR